AQERQRKLNRSAAASGRRAGRVEASGTDPTSVFVTPEAPWTPVRTPTYFMPPPSSRCGAMGMSPSPAMA
ncbi:hypothetical protein DSI35_27795, partial [Mycobacterium tuberculosis]